MHLSLPCQLSEMSSTTSTVLGVSCSAGLHSLACLGMGTRAVGPALIPVPPHYSATSATTMLAMQSRNAGVRPTQAARPSTRVGPIARASISADVPDMDRRNVMNLVLLGGLGLPVGTMAVPFLSFFVPPSTGGGEGGQSAKDALGNDVKSVEWLKTHGPNDRALTQGLKGDPTYLVVNSEGKLENYGVNAVCTHLGCVVPWNVAENKFKCPCHGSQYNAQGKVVRGPAPLSLALAHADINPSDIVTFSTWSETDFRDGSAPWWH